MDFPQYRMYSDGNTLFEIYSTDRFKEIKRTGKYFMVNEIDCNQYPEKVFVSDLLNCENNVQLISEEYFNAIKNEWSKTLKEF